MALLPGGVIPNRELFDLQREVGRPITWTALLTVKGYPYHEKVVAENDAARRRRGRGVAAGVVPAPRVPDEPGRALHPQHPAELRRAHGPRPRGAHGRLSGPGLACRDVGGALRRRRRPALQLAGGVGGRVGLAPRPRRTAAWSSWPTSGAARPLDVLLDISLDDDLKTRFWSVLANNDPDGIAWLLPRDNVLLGLADSGAHVSQLCDACFATDLLGTWVRDREVMSARAGRAQAHRRSPPASTAWSTGGRVEVGKAADLCVFDPATVAPGPLRRVLDFPADGERLTADAPVGMTHVLVNGVPIRARRGAGARRARRPPGALLRS